MALTVGGVAIDLSANASQVVNEMEKAARATLSASQKMQGGLGGWLNSFRRVESGINGFAGRVVRSLGSIGRALPNLLGIGGFVGGAGLAGLGLLAKQSVETASAIVDAADKAGIGTTAYQALSFQAIQVGLSVEQLNTGLTTFATRVGQARAGTGALSSTMNKLNPELAAALRNTRSQEEALRIVADAMSSATTQTDRLAIEQAAFGRGAGGAFTLALRGGSIAIDEFTARARELGIVIDEQLLRTAEQAGDQLDILGAVIKAQLTGAMIQAAPAIAQLALALTQLIPKITETAVEWGKWLGILKGTELDTKRAELGALQSTLDQVDINIGEMATTITDLQAAEGDWGDELAHGKARLGELIASQGKLIQQRQDLIDQVQLLESKGRGEGAPVVRPPPPAVVPDGIEPPSPSDAATRNTEAATAALERLNATVQQSRQIAQTAGLDRLLPQIGASEAIRDAVIELGAMRTQVDDVFRSELELQKGTERLSELFRILSAALREAGGGSAEIEKLRGQILGMQAELEETAAAAQRAAIPPAPPEGEIFGPPKPDPGVLHEEQRGLEINRQLEERQRLYDQLTNTANMFASTVSQGFTSAITGAQTFDEALRGIAEALIEAAIQAAIFQAISAAIGTPGPAGGGALGAAFPAAAGARAGGGPVRAGSAYKVGERGAEYFVPSVGGNILTQSQMAGAGGGRSGGDVYNIYADRIDPGTAARLVNTARAGAPAATVNAMSRGTVRSERRPPF